MPHITVTGEDTKRQIKMISIHAEVDFSREVFSSPKGRIKLNEIKDKIQKLVEEYFDAVESDIHSNHEWNLKKVRW